jgi:hypothetical protein
MGIRLDIEIWEIDKGGTKRGSRERSELVGNRYGGCWVLWTLHVFGCISAIAVEGACVTDCRGLGLCTVGTVG